ncbi:REP element-mobilizing transposase RayT [Shimia gijangensis]|uniref:REP element-mobilizing transposase RayT n=1 Tax=Shimia gijangensis TaxID=1470563 RepID=A0A1M6Q434_9RHOB|nr:transposase [Shimia gijangensis]SHK14992.1 REP element-mobilizing transposase RayT [Shimia gijangensis]
MSNYRRPKVSGVPVFFTVTLANRQSDLLVREIKTLRDAVRITRAERPFEIKAWVVLPDHLHCIWRLPKGDREYGTRWGAIKARFTRAVRAQYATTNTNRRPGFSPDPPPYPTEFPVITKGRFAGLKPGLRKNKREQAIWQRRFWE